MLKFTSSLLQRRSYLMKMKEPSSSFKKPESEAGRANSQEKVDHSEEAGKANSQEKVDHSEEAGKANSQEKVDHSEEAVQEFGGPSGPEPTRYGDWERKGRTSDF